MITISSTLPSMWQPKCYSWQLLVITRLHLVLIYHAKFEIPKVLLPYSILLHLPMSYHFPFLQTTLEWQPWNNLMSINEIIQCICHDASTSRFPMKDNLPPWNIWLTPIKYLLNMWSKHKRFIKLMQQIPKINNQKACIISLAGWVAFIIIPIFHSFARK